MQIGMVLLDPLDCRSRIFQFVSNQFSISSKDKSSPFSTYTCSRLVPPSMNAFDDARGLLKACGKLPYSVFVSCPNPLTAVFTASSEDRAAQVGDLSQKLLRAMCKKGSCCECAKAQAPFSCAFNAIGADEGLGGVDLLANSRASELDCMVDCMQIEFDMEFKVRPSLIQISQCSGIGKTTLLGLIARKYPELLRKANFAGKERNIIGSLVTFNGRIMPQTIKKADVQTAISVRVVYGALRSHPCTPETLCSNLKDFPEVLSKAVSALSNVDVDLVLAVLWHWFGKDRPIFIGVDETIKCEDGLAKDRMKNLMTALGKFVDLSSLQRPVFLVVSSLSPNKLLVDTVRSNRAIRNILVYPLSHSCAVEALRASVRSRSNVKVVDSVISQFAAICGGHPRALQAVSFMISRKPDIVGDYEKCRTMFIETIVKLSNTATGFMAESPDSDLVEYLISQSPREYIGEERMPIRRSGVSLDNLIFSGKVLINRGCKDTLTLAAWWLIYLFIGNQDYLMAMTPYSWLLKQCFIATNNIKALSTGNLWEAFVLFCLGSALRRGGDVLEATFPSLYDTDPIFRLKGFDQLTIERVAVPKKPTTTVVIPGLSPQASAQVDAVQRRVDELIAESRLSPSKYTILVMPKNFVALDAIFIGGGQRKGIQIKSQMDADALAKKIKKCREWIDNLAKAGYDILGPSREITYYLGSENKPTNIECIQGETIVSAGQLRPYFLDVFFRFGLTEYKDTNDFDG